MSHQDRPTGAQPGGEPVYTWTHFSRFVEVHPVQRGWLVLWGRYEDLGRRKVLTGNRTYPDLDAARRRVADAVLELTRRPVLAAEAIALFDRTPLPERADPELLEPL